MKKLRYYFLILNYLLQDKYPTREDLIKHLNEYNIDISERTLYRALNELSTEFGVAIRLDNVQKGYYIAKQNEVEAREVLSSLKNLVTTDILSNSNKSKVSLGKYLEQEVNKSIVPIDTLHLILKAMVKNQKISFTVYHSHTRSESTHIVAPLFFKQYQDCWYLIVKEGERVNSYDLDNLSNIKVLKDKFKENREKIKSIFNESLGLDFAESELKRVKLLFDSNLHSALLTDPIHCSQVVDLLDNENKLKVSLEVRPNEELKQYILKYGSAVSVVEPLELKQEIIEELHKAIMLNA
ncbi:helix-turn-helix transcriptional regulator [Myroides injenensis]|uniref:helix-turn-helix transcriptional regulator n=1 Tax=Myroides injenensis TaxID=1183151 RepID=UPI0002899D47|nr:WYL domain-containing protein [Myroides injenensis]